MKQIDKNEVFQLLTPARCMAILRETLPALEQGRATQYLRTVTPLPSGDILGYMPAAVPGMFGAKLITVFHHNGANVYPSHKGIVLLFDEQNGALMSMADGQAITEIRTGAASAIATDLLAAPEADTLALLGAGAQARSHLLAIREVRRLRQVLVWDKLPERARAFAQEMGERTGLPITPCTTAAQAVVDADIICTITSSVTPILERDWVKPGAHINAVGACRSTDRELDSRLAADAVFYCDNRESVLAEGGDFLIPMGEGLFDAGHLQGTLGQLLLGQKPGRTAPEQITIFESLGIAVEDIACAKALYEWAEK